MKVIQLNKHGFETKVSTCENFPIDWNYVGDKPAIIDFYADWCAPCRAIAPILDELASEYAGRVDFFKVNTDEEGDLTTIFGIRSIPTLLFIPMQGKPEISQGAFPKTTLIELIEKHLFEKREAILS